MSTTQGQHWPSKFIETYFEKGELKDRSNRRYSTCTFCSEKILKRENSRAQHISSVEECPSATPIARQWALREIAGKAKIPTATTGEQRDSRPSIEENITKKAKKGDHVLTTFMERPLDEATKNDLNAKLLRSVAG